MWTKLTIIGCLLLTAVVVHTALRIEHVNVLSGTVLPRSPNELDEKWELPELESVLKSVDRQIAMRRADAYSVEHPDQAVPSDDELVGEPYSEKELGLIERTKRDYTNYSALHWWVTNFGALQYAIAPLAFVWSIGNFLTLSKIRVRALSTTCALLALGAIFLMVFRGY